MMSDNDIRRGFQSKLSGYEAPIPPDGWESLQQSLNRAQAARASLRRKWYAGSVAAVLILLIGSILFMWNPEEETENILSQSAIQTPLTGRETQDADEKLPDVTSPSAISPAIKPSQGGVKSSTGRFQTLFAANRSSARENGKSEIISPSSPQTLVAKWMERERNDVGISENIELVAESITYRNEGVGREDHPILVEDANALGELDDKEIKRPLLLAVNGKGAMNGYQQTVNTPMTLRSASATPAEIFLNQEANKLNAYPFALSDNVSKMEHDQPVSFGITVSKYLTDDLSIETGLVYSFLRSKTRNSSANFEVQEVQKLHYLGIPVNVNYNLFNLNRLDVYASLGGMIEKDIYGEFRSNREGQMLDLSRATEASEAKEVTKISQDHPQISLNVGVGASYPLYDRLRLYGKIGGAYYFDANNPYKTIYSDRKIMLDLNVGLRYEFNVK